MAAFSNQSGSSTAPYQAIHAEQTRKRKLSLLSEEVDAAGPSKRSFRQEDSAPLSTDNDIVSEGPPIIESSARTQIPLISLHTPHDSLELQCIAHDVGVVDSTHQQSSALSPVSGLSNVQSGGASETNSDSESLGSVRDSHSSRRPSMRSAGRRVKLKRLLSAQEALCDTCSTLKLNYSSFVMSTPDQATQYPVDGSKANLAEPPFAGKKPMGTLQHISDKSEHCPLCRLLIRSLAGQCDDALADVLMHRRLDASIGIWKTRCEISWQIDGRETYLDDDGELEQVPRTRRLSIQWPESGYPDAHLVLMFPNKAMWPPKIFLGRYSTSIEEAKIDQIKGWFRICSEGKGNHGLNCVVDHSSQSFQDLRQESYFGVVDLQKMRLTYLPEGAEYAALSYTWGKIQNDEDEEKRFRTKLGNVDSLKIGGGIQNIKRQLPKTIQDTMDLVQKLGLRYLWVDSLCILQGDEELWALNADQMDTVYGNASVTICAADGIDATCGLKALEPPLSRYDNAPYATQHIERIGPDLQLMVSFPSETFIQRSTWNTRAWTFQERFLSKRCIIFAEGRVYFHCRSNIMSEDIYAEDATAGWSLELVDGHHLKFKDIETQPIEVYKLSVKTYTSRQLTKPRDILAAFSGIGKMLCTALGGVPIYGLPNTHFDFALLWKPETAPTRRVIETPNGKIKYKFPSWSWCGWEDSAIQYTPAFVDGCELNLHEWLMEKTWITWYIRDGRGNLRLVWDARLHQNDKVNRLRFSSSHKGYRLDRQAFDTRDEHGHPIKDLYGRPIKPPFRDPVKYRRNTFDRTMAKYSYQVRMVPPGSRAVRSTEPRPELDDQRFLQFWTWSAHFRITVREAFGPSPPSSINSATSNGATKSELVRCDVLDSNNNRVGTFTIGGDWLTPEKLARPHEFIAISEANKITKKELPWTYYEPLEGSHWYAYNVLLLDQDEEIHGVSRRAALGKIYKKAFGGRDKPKMWKEIILG